MAQRRVHVVSGTGLPFALGSGVANASSARILYPLARVRSLYPLARVRSLIPLAHVPPIREREEVCRRGGREIEGRRW